MSSRARCCECGELVLATQATPLIRRAGVVLICKQCRGTGVTSAPKPAERKANPLLAAKPVLAATPTRRPRAEREPIPEPEPSEDDYDAIYVSIEAEEPSDQFSAYPSFEIEADYPPIEGGDGTDSDGRDYASASGAIEVKKPTAAQTKRSDSTPPPAVVVGD